MMLGNVRGYSWGPLKCVISLNPRLALSTLIFTNVIIPSAGFTTECAA
jgi:hypothetical protein